MGTLPVNHIKYISNLVEKEGVEKARERLIEKGYTTREEINKNLEEAERNKYTIDPFSATVQNIGYGMANGVGGFLNEVYTHAKADWAPTEEQKAFKDKNKDYISKIDKEIFDIDEKLNNPYLTSRLTSDEYNTLRKRKDELYGELASYGNELTSLGKTSEKNILEKTMDSINFEIEKNVNAQNNGIAKKITEIAPSVGNMVVGGTIGLAQPVAGAVYMGASGAGQYQLEAKNKGANDQQALAYGDILGVAEGLTEKIQLGRLKGAFGKLTKGLVKSGTKEAGKSLVKEALKDYGINIAENFIQEAIMEPIQEGTSQLVLGKSDWDNIGSRMINAGIDGALVATIMVGANAGLAKSVNVVNKISNGEKVSTQDINQAIYDMKDHIKTDNEAVNNAIKEAENNQLPVASQKVAPVANEIESLPKANKEYIDNLTNRVNEILPTANQINTKYEELPSNINGSYLNNEIVLNSNNLSTQKFGHELTHHLSQSKGFEAFSDYILTELDKNNQLQPLKDEIYNTYSEQYAKEGRNLTDDIVDEEIVARYSERLFKDEKEINKLIAKDRNVVQKIYDWIVDKIDTYKVTKNMTEEQKAEYQMLKNAQKLYQKALKSDFKAQITMDLQSRINDEIVSTNDMLETATSNTNKRLLINQLNNSNLDVDTKQSLTEAINGINVVTDEAFNDMVNQINDMSESWEEYNENQKTVSNKKFKYNRNIVEDATAIVPANRQGRRTKAEWLKVAEQIATNVEDKTELRDYAEKSWRELHPNIKENLNRQGQKYVRFTKDEWINVFENANDKKYALSKNASNDIDTIILQTKEEADKDNTQFVKLRDNTIKHLVDKGIPDLPMLERVGHVRENILTEEQAKELGYSTKGKHYHGLGKETYLNIIDSMDNATAIYQYTDKGKYNNNNYIVVTPVKINDKKTIVPVEINSKGQYNYVEIDFNKIKSAYSIEQDNYLENMVSQGKIKEIFTQSSAEQTSHINNSITSSKGKVNTTNNNSMQNDKRYSIAGKKGATNLNYNTIDKYNQALQMNKVGVNNEDIRQATGWFKDKNGDWKFEFTDKYMELKEKLKPNTNYKLGDILKHDTLFEAYPELKNYNVKIKDFGKRKAGGNFNKVTKDISLNNKILNNSELSVQGTLIHEIQHAIQDIENFEGGKSSRGSKLAYYNSLGEIEAKDTQLRFIQEKKGKNIFIAPESSKQNPKHNSLDNYLNSNRKVIDKIKDSVYNFFNNRGDSYEDIEEDYKEDIWQNNGLVDGGYRGLNDTKYSIESDNKSGSFFDNKGRRLSKEQQEYFRDSIVKDDDGNLLTVYHGTPYEFNQFKYDKLGENTSSLGAGFYFTDKIETAEEYKKGGGNVKEVYLDIKKPLKYGETTMTKSEYGKFIKAINKETNGTYFEDYGDYNSALMEYDYGGDDIDLVSAVHNASGLSYDKTFEILRDTIGFDGIVSDEGFLNKGEKIYVALNSNQIKNVDNVNPTTNSDIRYALEKGQRKHYESIKNSSKVSEMGRGIAKNLLENERYIPIKNTTAMNYAETKLQNNGINDTYTEFKNKLNSNDRMSVKDIALGERLIQELSKAGDYQRASEVIQDVAMLGTELGQQVQAMSLINKMTPEGQLSLLEKTINRLNKNEKNLTQDIKLKDSTKENILKASNQEELDKAISVATQEIAEQIPLNVSDKLRSWRYLSMLGNPRTHIRNILSNVAMKATQGVKNKIAGAIEDITTPTARTKTAKRSSKETLNFASQDAIKMQSRLADGGHEDIMSKVKFNKRSFDNKMLNKLAEFNSNMLEKEDWIFLKSAYKNALANYMTANNLTSEYLSSGSKTANVALESARAYAINQAQEATFRQYSALANAIGKIENLNAFSKFVVGGALPFKKTPINIAKAGFEYSPIGLLKATKEFALDIKSGKKTVNQAIDSMSKGLTGTSIVGLGMLLASMGILKGSGSDDDKEENYLQSLGEQKYSVKIGNKTYTLDWLSPTAMPLFVGVELYNSMQNTGSFNLNNLASASAQTINPLMEMSMLQSFTSALSSYSSEGTAGKLSDVGLNIAESYIGQFIPTISAQIARTIDDTERNTTYSDKKGFEKTLDKTKNRILAKIPFASMSLQPKTDIWGNEVKRDPNVLVRAGQQMIAPYYSKEIQDSKVDSEIKRVYAETADNKVLPTAPNSKVTINSTQYTMTPKDYTTYKKDYGNTAKKTIESIITTEEYKSLNDEEKSAILQKIYDDTLNKAKSDYAKNNNIDYKEAETTKKINELKDEGLSTINSYIYTGKIAKITGTKDSSGKTISGTTSSNKAKYIMNMNTSNAQKNMLLSLLSDSDENATVSDLNLIKSKDYSTYFSLNTTTNDKGISQRDKYVNQLKLGIEEDVLKEYYENISKITGSKDSSGKTISGSKKTAVFNYLNSLNTSGINKAILYAYAGYGKDYASDLFNYIINMDLTAEEKKSIWNSLNIE